MLHLETSNTAHHRFKEKTKFFGFSNPYDLLIDLSQDQIFVCESGSKSIKVFDLNSRELKYTIQVNGEPFYIDLDPIDSEIVFGTSTCTVCKYSLFGKLIWEVGAPGSNNGQFDLPSGIAIDLKSSHKNIFVCDQGNSRIQVLDRHGNFLRTFGKYGTGDLCFNYARYITIGNNDHLYITDRYNHRIQVVTKEGQFISAFGEVGSGDGQLMEPCCCCVDRITGNIFVSDSQNNRIQVFTPLGRFVESIEGVSYPLGMSLNERTGDLYVSEWVSSSISVLKDSQFDSKRNFLFKKLLREGSERYCDLNIQIL